MVTPVKSILNRGGVAQVPLEPFQLNPLPPKLLKAFPEMEEWWRQQNEYFEQWVRRTNNALNT